MISTLSMLICNFTSDFVVGIIVGIMSVTMVFNESTRDFSLGVDDVPHFAAANNSTPTVHHQLVLS